MPHPVWLVLGVVIASTACGPAAERTSSASSPDSAGRETAALATVGAGGNRVQVPGLVLEACDSAAAVWTRRIRNPTVRRTADSVFDARASLAGRRGCVAVIDGLQDSTGAGFDDLRLGLPGARWFAQPARDADGAGSSSFAVWRPGVFCVTNWEVPAGIDDNGQMIIGDTEHVTVACAEDRLGDAPDTTGIRD